MSTLTLRGDRRAYISNAETEAERWNSYVETLLRAFQSNEAAPPSLESKLEALRNKRDTLVTKVVALEHHHHRGWSQARSQYEGARHGLRDAWRSVIGTLNKDSLFV